MSLCKANDSFQDILHVCGYAVPSIWSCPQFQIAYRIFAVPGHNIANDSNE